MVETHEKRTETHACDLISRAAVLNLIKQSCCDLEYDCDNVALRKEVEALPSAQQWVLCSERMPRDDEEVIVTIYDDSGDSAFSYTTVGWHYKGLWVVDDERCLRVTAWMPLPEPWEGET